MNNSSLGKCIESAVDHQNFGSRVVARWAAMGRNLWAILGFGLMVFLAACSSAPAVGTLQVNISGLPSGTNANVSISGPNGFNRNLTATTPLSGLVPGAYTVNANTIASGGKTFFSSVEGNPATVSAGTTSTVTVNYQPAGTLTINFVGLPFDTQGSSVVTGPGGFNQTFSDVNKVTLSNLLPGQYSLSSNSIRVKRTVVDSIFDPTPESTTLTVGPDATVTHSVNYIQREGTGALWIPTNKGFIKGYADSQLATSGTVEPRGSLLQTGINEQAVFDQSGRLYVSNSTDNAIYSAIGGLPAIQGANTKLKRPRGMAFDKNGNLWVTSGGDIVGAGTAGDDLLLAFTPAQLQAGGNQTPSVVLTSTSFVNPVAVAFDADGGLWVSNTGTFGGSNNGSIIKLNPANLSASGSVTAATTISGLDSPTGLAFDPSGNLWVADFTTNRVLKFTPAQLQTGGGLSANAILEGFTTNPRGLVFDNGGSLWVLQETSLQQISAADLTASGTRTPIPAHTISGFGSISLGLAAFSPTPSNLPIQNK